MAPSSPYAPFQAEEWMRASAITPRKRCHATAGSKTLAPVKPSASIPMKKVSAKTPGCSWIQGDLFQEKLPC